MPKLRKRDKGAPKSSAKVIRRKFRVGTRESGVSALQMSTEDLKKTFTDPNKKRYRHKVKAVLEMRGVTV